MMDSIYYEFVLLPNPTELSATQLRVPPNRIRTHTLERRMNRQHNTAVCAAKRNALKCHLKGIVRPPKNPNSVIFICLYQYVTLSSEDILRNVNGGFKRSLKYLLF